MYIIILIVVVVVVVVVVSAIRIGHPYLCHPSCKPQNGLPKFVFVVVVVAVFTVTHLLGRVCLKRSATLILVPLSKMPSRLTCSLTISKLSFS